jgi:hypothetical protein
LLIAALAAPASACPKHDESPATAANASQAENLALLEALVTRRAELARGSADSAAKSEALAFLDRQIAEIRSRLGG